MPFGALRSCDVSTVPGQVGTGGTLAIPIAPDDPSIERNLLHVDRRASGLFIPKEIAHNRVMAVRWIRHRAQERHYTGNQQNSSSAHALLEGFESLVPDDLSGCRVLELGPGKGTALMEAGAPRAHSYAAFDIEPYLTAEETTQLGVDYRVDASGVLPWEDGTFDVIWSHAVLEHLREPGHLLTEAKRALKPGGVFIAFIDLLDLTFRTSRKRYDRIYVMACQVV